MSKFLKILFLLILFNSSVLFAQSIKTSNTENIVIDLLKPSDNKVLLFDAINTRRTNRDYDIK